MRCWKLNSPWSLSTLSCLHAWSCWSQLCNCSGPCRRYFVVGLSGENKHRTERICTRNTTTYPLRTFSIRYALCYILYIVLMKCNAGVNGMQYMMYCVLNMERKCYVLGPDRPQQFWRCIGQPCVQPSQHQKQEEAECKGRHYLCTCTDQSFQ